jgi:CheY-like chemotaxis protein
MNSARRILLLTSDTADRVVIGEQLKGCNLSVETVRSYKEANHKIRFSGRASPDLIILALYFSDAPEKKGGFFKENGVTLLSMIRASETYKSVPVIFIRSLPGPSLGDPLTVELTEPINTNDLFRKVAMCLKVDVKELFAAQRTNRKLWKSQHSFANTSAPPVPTWDVFLCHASEDKHFAGDLAKELTSSGLNVWYDEFCLNLGDSLRERIDHGLATSRFGIVVLSPNFFKKKWTAMELNALVSREVAGNKLILPIWLNLSFEQVCAVSPILADRVAAKAEDGIARVATKILQVVKGLMC